MENIPGPLLDRMEVISLVGYITDEKVHIARGYLEKAARDDSGVKPDQVPHSIPLPAAVFVAHCESWEYEMLVVIQLMVGNFLLTRRTQAQSVHVQCLVAFHILGIPK